MVIIDLFVLMISLASCVRANNNLLEENGSLQQEVMKLSKAVHTLQRQLNEVTTRMRILSTFHCDCGPCRCRFDDRLPRKYFCDCLDIPPQRDCLDHLKRGSNTSGVYKIHHTTGNTTHAYCDQSTDDGGWTVFQRRVDGSVDFARKWDDYKLGFGDLYNEFWWGNENIFAISEQGLRHGGNGTELRIELEDWSSVTRYAKYSTFRIGNATTKYRLHVSDYSGNAGDGGYGLSYHSGLMFSTPDNDNDECTPSNCSESYLNCAAHYSCGWWFKYCFYVNLNAVYRKREERMARGIEWWPFHSYDHSLKMVEMKVRRKE